MLWDQPPKNFLNPRSGIKFASGGKSRDCHEVLKSGEHEEIKGHTFVIHKERTIKSR